MAKLKPVGGKSRYGDQLATSQEPIGKELSTQCLTIATQLLRTQWWKLKIPGIGFKLVHVAPVPSAKSPITGVLLTCSHSISRRVHNLSDEFARVPSDTCNR